MSDPTLLELPSGCSVRVRAATVRVCDAALSRLPHFIRVAWRDLVKNVAESGPYRVEHGRIDANDLLLADANAFMNYVNDDIQKQKAVLAFEEEERRKEPTS